MWIDYLPFAMLAHNMYNSLNLSNYSPYELVFGRKPKLLLDLDQSLQAEHGIKSLSNILTKPFN